MSNGLRHSVAVAALAILAACGGGGRAPAPASGALDDLATTLEASTVDVAVLANDGFLDVPPAVVTIATAPEHGTATVEPDRTVRYQPDAGWNGADSLVYRVQPAVGAAGTATLTVTTYRSVAAGAPAVLLLRTSISAREIGVVVNDSDPQSVAVAAYYAASRHVPPENVVHVSFPAGGTDMTAADLAPSKAAVDAALGAGVEALVLTWTNPFRVEGMAVTSAFAFGYDAAYANPGPFPCAATLASPYFASESTRPFTDLGFRPTMMLAGESVANVEALIDRGVAADDTFPTGPCHLVRTTDSARSVRWPSMVQAVADWDHAPDGLSLVYTDDSAGGGSDVVTGATGVLFYLTGLASVAGIDTNTYAPGAVADHLTSYAGILTGPSGQMSALRWLEAGVTASFGTVEEPCNFTEKFPDPGVLLDAYYRGATVLEAYWRSVAWPGEGVFVGEPLARPFGRATLDYDAARTLTIRTTSLVPGRAYDLVSATTPAGPFQVALGGITVPHHMLATITLPSATRAVYRLQAH